MAQIEGPVIRFRIDLSELTRGVRRFESQMQSQFNSINRTASASGRSLAANFIDPILQKAAKLKAQIAAGLKTPEQELRTRKRIVDSLATEIDLLTRKRNLSRADLSELKKATYEIERQKNALAGLPDITNRTLGAMRAVGTSGAPVGGFRLVKPIAEINPVVLQSMRKFGIIQGENAKAIESAALASSTQTRALASSSAQMSTAAAAASRQTEALSKQSAAGQMAARANAAAGEAAGAAALPFGKAALQLRQDGLSAQEAATSLRTLGASQAESAAAVKAAYSQMGQAAVVNVGNLNQKLRDSVSTLRTLRMLSYSTLGLLAVGFYIGEWERFTQWIQNAALAMGGLDVALKQVQTDATSASLAVYFAGGNLEEKLLAAARQARTLAEYQKSELQIRLQSAEAGERNALTEQRRIESFSEYSQLQRQLRQLGPVAVQAPAAAIPQIASINRQIDAIVKKYGEFTDLQKLSSKDLQALTKQTDAAVQQGSQRIIEAQTAISVARLTAEKKVTSELDKQAKELQKQLALYRGLISGHRALFGFTPEKIAAQQNLELAKRIFAAGGVLPPSAIGTGGVTGNLAGLKLPVPVLKPAITNIPGAAGFPSRIIPVEPFSAASFKQAEEYEKLYEGLQGKLLQSQIAMADDRKTKLAMEIDQLNLEYQRDVANYQKMLGAEQISQQQFLDLQLERQKLYNAQVEELRQQDIQKAEEAAKTQADRVFSIISGTSKNIGQAFAQMARSIALAPFQKVFESVFTGIFEQMNAAIAKMGDILSGKSKGKTPPFFPQTKTAGGIAGTLEKLGSIFTGGKAPGAAALAVSSMNVTAGTVILSGSLALGGGVGTGTGGLGGLLQNLPFGKALGSLFGLAAPAAGGLSASLLQGLPLNLSSASQIGASLSGASSAVSSAAAKMGSLSKIMGTAGTAIAGAGLLASAIFGGSGHTVGGVLQGAAGGALTGLAFGGPIGAAIGGIAGAVAGFFGHRDNTAAWVNHIAKAAARQKITLPPSETFAFSSMSNLAKTFSTTFSEGPGGVFTNAKIKANTPFWAHPIIGTPYGITATRQWEQMMSQFQSGLPFFGQGTNPFTGGPLPKGLFPLGPNSAPSTFGWQGYGGTSLWGPAGYPGITPSQAPSVTINLHVPGYVDKAALKRVANDAGDIIARKIAPQFSATSSGLPRAVRLSMTGKGF